MTSILFVDDDLRAIRPWVETCRDAGYHCDVAAGPDGALDLLSRSTYQVAVIDIMLPVQSLSKSDADSGMLTGLALIAHIRKLNLDSMKILLLSVRSDVAKLGADIGVDGISKIHDSPLDLVQHIKNILNA